MTEEERATGVLENIRRRDELRRDILICISSDLI